MIEFNYETDFQLDNEDRYVSWIQAIIASENKIEGEISFVFCDDDYLHKLNVEYLEHDTLTDIITFDYCIGNELSSDIFISIERVIDNANDFKVPFIEELHRVMSHGILHLCGYKDKLEKESAEMRTKENQKIELFHVER